VESPPALEPRYSTASPNAEVVLYEGDIAAVGRSGTFSGTGVISWNWMPTPRLKAVVSSKNLHPPTDDVFRLDVAAIGLSARAHFIGAHTSVRAVGEGESVLETVLPGPVEVGSPAPADALILHIPNFPDHDGEGVGRVTDRGGQHFWRGRLVLTDIEWVVTLDSLPGRELQDALRRVGGYAITHTARLERSDGREFLPDDATDVLRCLGYALSFASGAATTPVLATAEGANGWECWGVPSRLSPWRGRAYTFPTDNRDYLPELFGCFAACHADDHRKEVLTSAVSWYLDANDRGIADPAIVEGQVGLELLGWSLLTQCNSILSPDGYLSLKAHDQLRVLLATVGIPLEVPPSLPALLAFARQRGWDGPEAVTLVRNRLVHPPRNNRERKSIPPEVKVDAGQLASWYLELCILNYVGFSGSYSNRFTPSRSGVPVPWA
jgi:hypothetical protein